MHMHIEMDIDIYIAMYISIDIDIYLYIAAMQEHTVASAARPHPEVVLEGIEAPPLDRIPPTVALDPQNIAIPTPGVYPDGCVLAPS